ncbi:hypothetical protein HMPREF3100_03505 [Enterococcus sp. HMSC29A04]|nr:helix-turn-helix transcriptional regulator [Enterococcus raffinosus]MZZ66827.1 helix-turn-helix domain-containing protein [Enterococcus raffinosus]OFT89244.1 hypothetical protein HMPREF3100_03505 [Enterococcus sp. HMSC29A04]OFU63904.1 hypothetical protein HMPREF3128_10120 [Enterococcus sp. HMSC14A10]HAQ8928495.1 helix-turn-helix transcriptional regulator [Enterococcus faecium]
MKKVARNLHTNLYVLMGQSKPIKATELSKMSGVSVQTISKIKNDYKGELTPKMETVVKLADALDVEPYELIKEA